MLRGLTYLVFWQFFYLSSKATDIPIGHLKPFGSHKPPTVVIQEYTVGNAPDPETFFKNHVNVSKPAIFRGAVKDSDAFKLWTDEYIRERYGEMEVRMEGKKEKSSDIPLGEKYVGRDTMRHFVDHYHEEGNYAYVVSDLPTTIHHEVGVLPSLGACGEMAKSFVEIDIWWSGGQSRSVIHKDSFNQMNCLLNGTKYWKLIEQKYEDDLYKHPEHWSEVGGFSDIDVDAVDLLNQPKVKNIEWSNFTINRGDCLFLPKSYYHQVKSVETHNIAVSILFRRFDNSTSLDFSDCTGETDYRKLRRLSEFDIMWPYNGTGMMWMGNGDLEEQYRPELARLIQHHQAKGSPLRPEHIIAAYEVAPNTDMTEEFNAMDLNKDGILSLDEVHRLTWHELRELGKKIEPFEPSNSYEMEYHTIKYERVASIMTQIRSRMTELTRKKWIQIYRSLGGLEKTGNEIYDRLGGGAEPIICKDIADEDIESALYRWIKLQEDHPKISGQWNIEFEERRRKEEEEEEEEEEGEEEEEDSRGRKEEL